MKRITASTASSLLAFFLLAAGPAVAQDSKVKDSKVRDSKVRDSKDKERHRLVIENREGDDCLRAIRLGEDGPELLSLGSHAYLGVELTGLTPELRRHFGVPDDAGVLVGRVDEDSPAAAAGLQVGDILTRFDDEDVTSAGRLGRLVRARDKDDQVTLEYFRDGRAATTTVTLGERRRCGFDVSGLVDLEELPRIDFKKLPLIELEEFPALEGLRVLELGGGDWEESAKRLRDAFESQDWEGQLKRLQEIDVDGIELRLREAMERLRELEDEIRSTREKVEDGPQA